MDSSKIKRGVTPNGGSHHDSDEILSDIRRTRSRMDHTLDELGDKLQPRHIMEEAVDYFWTKEHHAADKAKQSVSQIGKKVVDEVRDHPLPALLIGAGVVWLLSQQKEKDRTAAEYSIAESEGPGLKEKIGEAMGSAREKLQGTKEKLQGTKESVMTKASEMSDKAKSAWGATKGKSGEVAQKTKDYYHQTTETIRQTSETHPLAVGLGCMVAGVLAGVLAPRSRMEDRAFGGAADRIKEEGKEKAQEVVEKGERVGEKAMEAAREEARKEDLTPEGLSGTQQEFHPGESKAGPVL